MQSFVARDLAQLPHYKGTERQIVIPDTVAEFYGADLVQNDPWLRGNVIRMYSHGRTADREMLAQYYPAMHLVFTDHFGWVWSENRMSTAPNNAQQGTRITRRDTTTFQLALIWILGAVICLGVGLAPLSAAFIDGHYIPGGTDAFYHGRRILDAVANPSGFYQFDPQMDVPEGSLITWPWSYDWVLSLIVRAALALHLAQDPLAVLDHLPVLGFVFAMSLVMVICRQLQLSLTATLLAVLATALLPLHQSTFQVGNFHHHFAEQLFVLGTLAAGITWLRTPERVITAVIAGAALGIAVGVHTAQFILQLPVVAALAILWLRRIPLPNTLPAFAAALFGGTLAVALPSLPLREGHFETWTCRGSRCTSACAAPSFAC